MRCLAILAVVASLTDSPAFAADDADQLVQGEYQGEITKPDRKVMLGVQVIALGNGKFRAVSYYGGLPGDGWDKQNRRESNGETLDGVTAFKESTYIMKAKDGSISILSDSDRWIGQLQKVVRQSPTLGAKPPEGAVNLFDGKINQFDGQMTDDGLLKQGATSKPKFKSGKLHIEFRLPSDSKDIQRGNSGCYLQSRYEVQILNSMGLEPHNHECGGIPGVKAPDVNMCFPSDSWQTYDIDFTAAEYRDSKKLKHARMTVRQNGVLIHDDVEVPLATQSSRLPEGPDPGPINLQDHGSEVRYRNIWFVEK